MEEPSTAVIYCRISSDPTGEGVGVERQREECERLAQRLGLTVVTVYTDNNLSAFSGVERPQYKAMLNALRGGEASVVLAWNIDRLYRRIRELEDYIELVESRRIRTETCIAGTFDLNTPMGRAMIRNAITFATLEVETTRERVRTAKRKMKMEGKYSGTNRPFGYEKDGVTVRQHEFDDLRLMFELAVAGKSWNQIATHMNLRGSVTSRGRAWSAIKIQSLLTRKRNFGVIDLDGVEYKAEWPAVFSPEERNQLEAAAAIRASLRNSIGNSRVYLLVGLVYCGVCGGKLISGLKQNKSNKRNPTWRCVKYRAGLEVGCGKVSRLQAPVEELISDAVVYRLNTPGIRTAIALMSSNEELVSLISQERAQEALLAELLEDRATGLLSRQDYAYAKGRVDNRLDTIRRAIASQSASNGASLPQSLTREDWDRADNAWKRQVLNILFERIDIMPSDRRHIHYKQWRQFNPELISPKWRV